YTDYLLASTTNQFHEYQILNITSGELIQLPTLTMEDAMTQLNLMVAFFKTGLSTPIPFIEKIASGIKNSEITEVELLPIVEKYFNDTNYITEYEYGAFSNNWFDEKGCRLFIEFFKDIYCNAQ